MAGFFNASNTQTIDPRSGLPASGAKLYFFEGGTTTPLTVYRDYTVGIEHPNPITLDAYAVVPAIFLANDGSFYRYRLVMSDGFLVTDTDGIPVIGPTVSGGGGGDPVTPVDSRTLFQTGDEKWRYGTGFHDGWVRENGRTIGSATSGATERANADCEALFLYLWQTDANLSVLGGRGASAAADWAANKQLTLPDMRGRAAFGLDGMGNSNAGRIPAASITSTGGGVNVLGSTGGVSEVTLTEAQIPAHDHDATATQGSHSHTVPIEVGSAVQVGSGGTTSLRITTPGTATTTSTTSAPAITVDVADAGGGEAHTNMPPFGLRTLYIKL